MKHLQTNSRFYLIIAVALWCGATGRVLAQDSAANERGFQPGQSYALSNIESINMVNGNVGLNFPLASLPVGRGGLTASINLLYNSKLYDSEIAYFRDENQPCEMQGGDPPEGVLVCPYYQKQLLKPSEDGGWRYGMSYSLKLIDRRDQLANVPMEQRPQCLNSGPYGSLTPGYYDLRYRYKLLLVFPDGSSHEMRPNGWSDGNFNDPLRDYFDIRPDGLWDTCQSGPTWYPNTITYYSIDGTFLRLDIQHDSDDYWWNNPWTLYFPDGMRVTGGNTPQRIYDRNDNYVQINFIANYNGTGYGASQIVDRLNRSITLTSDGTEDLIISQGFGGTYTWKVRGKTIRVQKSYWPCEESLSCPPEVQQQDVFGMTLWMVDRITLPSQAGSLTYTFSYNAPFYTTGDPYVDSLGWGELSGITLPTGAHADYSYFQNGSQPYSATPDILRNAVTNKVLTYNEEYDGSSTPITETWTYLIERTGSTITRPDGGVTSQSFIDTQGTFWNSGQVFATIQPDGTKTETIWAWNELANNFHANPYPKTVFTSIKNAAGSYVKTAIKDYKYDKNGNLTRVAEYDWVDYATVPRDAQGMPTGIPNVSPTRVTVNTLFNVTPDATQLPGSNTNVYWSSGSPRVKNSRATEEVRRIITGGAEDPVTRVEYTYDNPSLPANLTQVRTWDSTKGAYTNPLTTANSLTATTQYNQYGMPTLVTDARGLKTVTTYGPVAGVSDLYPTQIKTAYQTAQERTENREYDFGTGLMSRVTDVNNNVSTFNGFDIFGRLTLVRAAEGTADETETTYEYSDVLRRLITRSEFAGTDKLVSIEHFDQLGRLRLRRQLETTAQSATNEEHGIKVQTRYRFSGANSFLLVSNAYRATTSSAAGSEPTMGWTRSKSDNAGRTIEVQTFGGAGLPAPWDSNTTSTGTVTTTYDANFTTVTDQAQKQRRSVTDALGRLIRVDEPDGNGNLGTTTSPNQPTSYLYDVLGNLTKVTQSDGVTTQNRDFVYSSLARLTDATNPESGPTTYKYDESGNLVVKTDARGVSVHYAYDSLNRLTRRWYNGSNLVSATTHNSPALPSGVGATDEVKFYYDAQSLPSGAPSYSRGASIGRLVAQIYGSGSNGDYFGYDPLGRATLKIQQIGAVNYQMSAAYNSGSAITSLTYPSGHTITNSYDQAGRLDGLSGNLGDGTTRTYSSGIVYDANGALAKEQFGTSTSVYNKLFYNSRGQLAEIRVSTSYTGPTDYSADRGSIINNYSNQCTGICYGSSMTDNNGNLLKQEIHIPNQQMRWQQYDYDSLNRLLWAREVLDGGAEQWKQKFIYDRWGNRIIDTGITYGTGINNKAFNVNTTNNRLVVPSGQPGVMSYDAAGNLTNDTYTGAGNRTYDAENKITSAWGGNNQAQLYSYDATGQRVKGTVDGLQTWHVYGFSGELIAEYAASGVPTSPQKEYGYRNGQLLITVSGNSGGSHSLSLNGTSNYAEAPSSATLNIAGPITVEAWIKINSTGAFQDIVTRESYSQSGTGGGYQLCVTNLGKVRLDLYQSPTQYTPLVGNTSLASGVWHHVAGVFDGSQMRVYLNGVLDGTLSTSNAPASGTSSLKIGRSSWGSYFGGLIDEARVSNAAIYTSNFNPAASLTASGSTKGLWKFDGQTLSDASTNGNHGTLISGTYSTNVPGSAEQNVVWTNAAGVTVNGNSLSKPGAAGWNAGASSTQAIASGDGYVQFIATETSSDRIIGLSNGDSNQNYTDVDFGFYLAPSGYLCVYEAGVARGCHGFYATGDTLRVAVESATVKYRKNGNLVYTSTVTPTYPLLVDTALYTSGSTISNVVISGNVSSGADVRWLVTDHLGTPRMIIEQTGSLANVKRHDYLPFGEELFAPTGGRSAAMGYASGDGVRQQFTSKERDVETGLDYFLARYYSSTQGRFSSVDPLIAAPHLSGAIKRPQGWNAYSYAINNPVKYLDPNGLRWAQRKLTNGSTEYTWFDTDEAYNAAIDSSSETYEGWTAVTFDETKPYTLITRSELEGGMFGDLVRWELAQLNPDGEVETGVVNFGMADILVDLGTQALFGKSWLEGKRSFQTTIEGLIGGLPTLPMAGGAFPPKPPTPNNMGTNEFGKNVMKWGTGSPAARARINELTKEELQRAGVTKEIAAQWRDFYREVARVTPANHSAPGRADLMQRAVELLSK